MIKLEIKEEKTVREKIIIPKSSSSIHSNSLSILYSFHSYADCAICRRRRRRRCCWMKFSRTFLWMNEHTIKELNILIHEKTSETGRSVYKLSSINIASFHQYNRSHSRGCRASIKFFLLNFQ